MKNSTTIGIAATRAEMPTLPPEVRSCAATWRRSYTRDPGSVVRDPRSGIGGIGARDPGGSGCDTFWFP